MPDNFLTENRVIHVADDTASNADSYATTAVQLDAYPEGGFEDVVFILYADALHDSVSPTLTVQVSDNGTFDATHGRDLQNATLTLAGDADDDHMIVVEVISPPEQYVRLLIEPGGQAADFSDVIAIARRPRSAPITYRTSADTVDDKVITFQVKNPIKATTTYTAPDS